MALETLVRRRLLVTLARATVAVVVVCSCIFSVAHVVLVSKKAVDHVPMIVAQQVVSFACDGKVKLMDIDVALLPLAAYGDLIATKQDVNYNNQ